MKLPKFLRLPTIVELGISKANALPSRQFNKFEEGYCWEDYYAEMKKKYPIRYFIDHTLSHLFAVKIRMPIEDRIYWVKSYLIHKDHLLDLRQPEGCRNDWYRWGHLDPYSMLLYACFSVLKIYIDKHSKCKFVDQNSETFIEAKKIYHYWITTRDELTRDISNLHKKARDAETLKENREIYKKIWDLQEEFEKMEEEMLIRLIKIRTSLWV